MSFLISIHHFFFFHFRWNESRYCYLVKVGSLFSVLLQMTLNLFFPVFALLPLVCVWSFPFSRLIFREMCALFLRMAKPQGSNVSDALSTCMLPVATFSLCVIQAGIIFFLSWQIPDWKSTIWPPGNRSSPLFYWTWITKGQPQKAQVGSALSLHWEMASTRIPHARYLVLMVGDVLWFHFALFVCLMANAMLKLFQK